MTIQDFFATPENIVHKQYEALRALYLEKKPAKEVASQFGYTINSLYSLARDFRRRWKSGDPDSQFFIDIQLGRKKMGNDNEVVTLIVALRKKFLSVPDIKGILDAQKKDVSEKFIYDVIKREGFARLPRRDKLTRSESLSAAPLTTPKVTLLDFKPETFTSSHLALLCLLPYIISYGIDNLIVESDYPGTKTLPPLNSILCFLALKLSNIRRYSVDDIWCMDRGLGLFSGVNVLPKAAWFTSYSNRVTREMNFSFLKSLNKLWVEKELLSDTANLDFTTIPYWGEDNEHLENNWSGTRHHALKSILAVLANDPDSNIITYGDTNIRHNGEADVAVEFLDFYKQSGGQNLKYLVFDSKFTTYENLSKLDENGVKFVTIRRRGKKIVDELNALPKSAWKKVRVPASGGTRGLKVYEHITFLKGYGQQIRQIAITGHGKIKPALIITNDFQIRLEEVIRKYAKRWLVEKSISEQSHFFHLNRVSSSMVIKVDFDLTMTILAHNLYRLFAANLSGYSKHSDASLYEKFIDNGGKVEINDNEIQVMLKKKRNLPAILEAMSPFQGKTIPWLENHELKINGASFS